jgi:hypothetical protein
MDKSENEFVCANNAKSKNEFVCANNAKIYDDLLRTGKISSPNVCDNYGYSSIHQLPLTALLENIDPITMFSYLLTCEHPADVNRRTTRVGKRSPMHQAALFGINDIIKCLIDFGGDRKLESSIDGSPNMTPLDIATEDKNEELINLLTENKNEELIKLLEEYFPSEEDKLASQLKYKKIVDSQFKDIGHPRFRQEEIDIKYESLERCLQAVKSGDLELLVQYLEHLDVRMGVSLTLIAIEKEHTHLFGCLFEKLVCEKVFDSISDESVVPLIYSGIDTTCRKPSEYVVDVINRSRVLSLFKILYPKYIFVDIDSIIELVQTLELDGM